jgi:DNA-binding beta-propeller fold protein YncE
LFVTNFATGMVSRFTTSGAPVNMSFITGLNGPIDIKAVGGFLYISNHADGQAFAGSISRYTIAPAPVGGRIITGLTGAESIAIFGDSLYVAFYPYTFGSTPGGVEEYDLRTLQRVNGNLIGAINAPLGIAVVPEPATATLVLVALVTGAVVVYRRRERRC